MSDDLDDAARVRAYARGERDALDPVVARRFPQAYRVALRALGDPGAAEDAAADALTAVVRGAERFEAGRAFGPWFGAVLMNAIRKQERSRRRRAHHEGQAAARGEPQVEGPDGARLDAGRVARALGAVPLDLRLPLVLHYQEGRSHAEVAEALGCPQGTASSRLRRGVERLREALVGAGATGLSVAGVEAALRAAAGEVRAPAAPTVARLEALARAGRGPAAAALARAARSPARVAALAAAALLPVAAALLLLGPGEPSVDEQRRAPGADVGPSTSAAPGTASAADAAGDASQGADQATAPELDATTPTRGAEQRVRGRVVDRQGRPVAGARVTLTTFDASGGGDEDLDVYARARVVSRLPVERRVSAFRESRWRLRELELGAGETGADGRFDVALAAPLPEDPSRRPLEVSVGARLDHGDVLVGGALVARAAVDVGDIEVRPCRRIHVVATSGGRPLAGADAFLSIPTADMGEGLWVHAVTDADGRALLLDTVGWLGAQVVVVRAPGLAAQEEEAEGAEDVHVAVDLVAEVVARGQVLDGDGRPLPGVSVGVTPVGDRGWIPMARVESGAAGEVTIAGLRPGRRYLLSAASPGPGLMNTEAEVVAAERLPALRLDVPLWVAVAVSLPPTIDLADFDARHRVELQRRRADGAWASARSGHEPRRLESLEGTLRGWDEDEGPDVVFRHMAPGVYRAIVDHPGHATAVSPPFELTPGGPAPRITLALAAGRLVRGRVVDLEGRPVAGANLDLVLGDHRISLAGTEEDGTFSLRELPEGLAVVLEVSALFGALAGNEAVRVEVTADATWLGDVVVRWSPSRGGAGEDDPDPARDEGR